jgi:transcriptional regulator with XRE-family HTH domain
MGRVHVDVGALYAALDAARRSRGMSWRQLSAEIGVSPSTMTRIANGGRPDVDAFAAMVTWLGSPAETFMSAASATQREEPELLVQLAPLLRSRRDLDPADVEYLEDVIGAAIRRFAAERKSGR